MASLQSEDYNPSAVDSFHFQPISKPSDFLQSVQLCQANKHKNKQTNKNNK